MAKLTEFEVVGPIKVPFVRLGTGAIHIAEDKLPLFWKQQRCGDERGCYVLAVQVPNEGILPVYVGLASKRSLSSEALNQRNINRFNESLNVKKKRRPLLFLVCQKRGSRGGWNGRVIRQVEARLIEIAAIRHPEIHNTQNLPRIEWRIRGVLNSKQGDGAIKSARAFKKMMGLD